MNFVSIDFETATADRNSACSVGIVTVENGEIVDEYYTLIQPPKNFYDWRTTRVHGLKAKHTKESPKFIDVYPEIKKRFSGKHIIAHNESFDRAVLTKSMESIKLKYADINIPKKWECTSEIYKKKGYKSTKLSKLCAVLAIELQHHDALSDARGCALLYLRKNGPDYIDDKPINEVTS
jgi:DNA polymerase-3 subunit epsilon